MKYLALIPARRDSVGIPGKNWKLLQGKPLIGYSIEIAMKIPGDVEICISTNALEIQKLSSETYGLSLPFLRPEELSTATTTTREVILHALEFYANKNRYFDGIILLQPTSPLRAIEHVIDCMILFESNACEMVTSVVESPYNPYYNIYLENQEGFIHRSIPSNYTRRQDCPKSFIINGAIYIIHPEAIKQKEIHEFHQVVKYEMPPDYDIDLDTLLDWEKAEWKLKNKMP